MGSSFEIPARAAGSHRKLRRRGGQPREVRGGGGPREVLAPPLCRLSLSDLFRGRGKWFRAGCGTKLTDLALHAENDDPSPSVPSKDQAEEWATGSRTGLQSS